MELIGLFNKKIDEEFKTNKNLNNVRNPLPNGFKVGKEVVFDGKQFSMERT